MKNILLMVPRLNVGGAETYTYKLAKLLHRKNFNVFVASGGGYLASKLNKEGIKTFFLPMRFSTYLSSIYLKYILKKYNIDLIHANSAAAGITAVKSTKNIPIIYTAHGIISHKDAKYLQNVNKIIAVSDFTKEQIISQGIDEKKVLTIYTGIDDLYINKDFSLKREDLNLKEDDFVLILSARVRNLKNKGHEIMLNLLKKHPHKNWYLLCLGDGSSFYKLKKAVKNMSLKKNVHLLGRKDNVADYLHIADVVVLPSIFETFGLSIAEGMIMKKPAIAFDVGGIPEIIKDGYNGFLIPYKNEELFYEKINTLYRDKKLRLQLGENAQKSIIARFSKEKMISSILEIYHEELNK